MSKLEQITKAIVSLPPEEFARLRDWFAEYEADQWDRQIERDAAEGKFERLAEVALADHKAGRTKPL